MFRLTLVVLLLVGTLYGAQAQDDIRSCTEFEFEMLRHARTVRGEKTNLLLRLGESLDLVINLMELSAMFPEASAEARAERRAEMEAKQEGAIPGTEFSVNDTRLLWLFSMPVCREAIDLYLAFMDYTIRAEVLVYTGAGVDNALIRDAELRLLEAVEAIAADDG